MEKELEKFIRNKLDELETLDTTDFIAPHQYKIAQYDLIEELWGLLWDFRDNKTQ